MAVNEDQTVSTESSGRAGRVISAVAGGTAGALLVYLLKDGHVKIAPTELRYEDLAAVLLSAVGVIVTVLGVVLAILAFWGFSQLKKDTVKAATSAAQRQVDRTIQQEISSPEFERRVRMRVDEILLGNAEKDTELDSDPENEGEADA